MRRIHNKKPNSNPNKLSALSNFIEQLKKLILPISLTVGVLLSFHYWMVIDFYPTGIEIGDTLFFLGVCFSIFFIVAIITIFLWAIAILNSDLIIFVLRLIKRRKIIFPKMNENKVAAYVLGASSYIIIGIALKQLDALRDYYLVMAVILTSFLYAIITLEEKTLWHKSSMVVSVTLLALFFCFNPKGIFEHFVMDTIGVREQNTTIRITEKYKEMLAIDSITPIKEYDNGDGLYRDAIILFKGVGDQVFIQIDSVKISIPNDDIIISSKVKK